MNTTQAIAVPAKREKSAYERLTRRQRRFVDEFVQGCSAAEAMRQSGYKGSYPEIRAYREQQDATVSAAITERTEQLAHDVGVRQHRVLRQMFAIATCDPRRLVDPATKRARRLEDLDEDTAAAISSVEIEDISSNGETGTRYKYRFWDKVKANDRLGQYVKLWDAKSGTVNVDARSVHIGGNAAGEGVLRAVDDLVARAAAVGLLAQNPSIDQDGSVLPAAVCDGPAGCGSPLDAGAHPGNSGKP